MYNIRCYFGTIQKLYNVTCKRQISLHLSQYKRPALPYSGIALCSKFTFPCTCSLRRESTLYKTESTKTGNFVEHGYKVSAVLDPSSCDDVSSKQTYNHIKDNAENVSEGAYRTDPSKQQAYFKVKQYINVIEGHLQRKELGKAIKLLEKRLIRNDHPKFNAYICSLIISACGSYGCTPKAFKLYHQMKKNNLEVPENVYTGLVDACVNNPIPEHALKYAKYLCKHMMKEGIQFNTSNRQSILKVFCYFNDAAIFKLIDELIDENVPVTTETFNFLFQVCTVDKEEGFYRALLVWHKMLQQNIKPNKLSFELLLQCVHDCSIGDPGNIQKIVEEFKEKTDQHLAEQTNHDILCVESNALLKDSNNSDIKPSDKTEFDTCSSNLLSKHPYLGNMMCLKDITRPQDRLLLLGGFNEFLGCMKTYDKSPDIKTYTLLLDCIPSTSSAEKALLKKMRKAQQTLDIEFCNTLIKKRSLRFDFWSACDVLGLIHQAKLIPNLVTFGMLSLGCTNVMEASQLVSLMRAMDYRMNSDIMEAMVKQACSRYDFQYIIELLNLAKEEDVKPNSMLFDTINNLISNSRDLLKKKNVDDLRTVKPAMFLKNFKMFLHYYKEWSKEASDKNVTEKQKSSSTSNH